MLALLGLTTVVVLLAVIIFKRMSPLVALILIPIIASLIGVCLSEFKLARTGDEVRREMA
jgi:Mg2+/citrate symporter